MTAQEALKQHQAICDELYALALEENRFLQQHRRPTEAPILDRKRALLDRLDKALEAMRSAEPAGRATSEFRAALDKARSRILQILQLDRENEQLLTRYSLSVRPARTEAAPSASASMLQRIYDRSSK